MRNNSCCKNDRKKTCELHNKENLSKTKKIPKILNSNEKNRTLNKNSVIFNSEKKNKQIPSTIDFISKYYKNFVKSSNLLEDKNYKNLLIN